MRKYPLRRWIALVAVALLVAAGCSDDDGSTEAGPESTAPPTSGTTQTSTPAEPVPSAGCGAAVAAVAKEKHTLQIAGEERYYLRTTPARTADDEPMPLVVDIHGLAEGAEIHTAQSMMGELGQQEGFAVVFPQGTGSPVRWDLDLDPAENADLQYITAALDEVEDDLCIDTSRVYAMGLSMGAMMTSTLASAMSDRIAAIAPVAGLQFSDDCDPDRPVPVQTFHGTADPILLFNGGVNTDTLSGVLGGEGEGGGEDATSTTTTAPLDLDGEGYPEAARNWAEHNGCGDSTDEDVSEEVILRTFDCPEGADVEFYIVEGGGHSWPGSAFSKAIESIVGHTTMDIDATKLIWEFLQGFRLPG